MSRDADTEKVVAHIESAFAITTAIHAQDFTSASAIIQECDPQTLAIAFARILHMVISSIGLTEDIDPDLAWSMFSQWTMETIAQNGD
jgi:hypothetical protein